MNVGTNDAATSNINNDDNNTPDGSSEAETILAVMDIDSYETSYDG